MACVVCKASEVKFRCVDCADELCLEHATACVGCRKALCPTHVAKTPGGRVLCATCMKSRNERHAALRAPQASPPQAAAPAAGFSFQDLMSDLPPVPQAPGVPAASSSFEELEGGMGVPLRQGLRPVAGDPRKGAAPSDFDDVPDPEIERKLAQMLGEAEGGARVLNASAPKSRPMWIGSTFLGVLTWVVFVMIPDFEPYSRYMVMILAGGSVVWALSGLRNEKDPAETRKLNLIGLIFAIAAGAAAYFHHGGSH